MSGSPARAVLFDATGTLIRTREPVGETYARLARDHGVAISAWRLEDAFRRVLAKAPAMVFPDAPRAEVPRLERDWWRTLVRQTFLAADSAVRPDDFDALFRSLWSHFAQPDAWEPLPGALEALAALRGDGFATAVVSNFDGRLPALLDGNGFGPLLDGVFLPIDAGAAKPSAAIFRYAARQLGVDPSCCVHVGDHPERDVAAARAAGMGAVDARDLATLADLPARIGSMCTNPPPGTRDA